MHTTLKGPADAGNFRVQVGRYGDRWYTDPLPACDIAEPSEWRGPSISTTKPPFANKYVPMKAIADMDSSEWTRLAGLDVTDRYEAIKAHDKKQSRINMSRGSLIHEWAEDLLAGQPRRFPLGYDQLAVDQALTFVPALEAFFDAHQPVLVASEIVCLHRTLNGVGYGGTSDAFAAIDGDVWVIDWKSRLSDHAAYLEEAAQGGGYAGAEYMIVANDEGGAKRIAVPDVAGVLIVSIRPDGFKAYPIDRDGAVKAYAAMHRWWVEQRAFADDGVIGRPWAPKSAAGGSGTISGTAVVDPPAAHREYIRTRIAKLLPDHEEQVRRLWPTGVAPLSKPGQTDAQLVELEQMIVKVEAEIGAPFDPAPIPPLAPTPLVESAPLAVPDEGGEISAADRAALERAFNTLSVESRQAIAQLATEAALANRSISVSLHPTVRRWSIARVLVAWCRTGRTDFDNLFELAAAISTPEQTTDPDTTLGALLGSFTIEQANRLHDLLDTTVAA